VAVGALKGRQTLARRKKATSEVGGGINRFRPRKTRLPAGFRRSTHNTKVLSLVERGGDIRSVTLDHRCVGRHLAQGWAWLPFRLMRASAST